MGWGAEGTETGFVAETSSKEPIKQETDQKATGEKLGSLVVMKTSQREMISLRFAASLRVGAVWDVSADRVNNLSLSLSLTLFSLSPSLVKMMI